MTTVFTQQARKSTNGTTYAPGKNDRGGYLLFVLRQNYDGQVRGGMRSTWRVVNASLKGLSLNDAKAMFEKKLGYKVYEEA